MEMEHINGKVEINMLENRLIVNLKVKELIHFQMEINMLENG